MVNRKILIIITLVLGLGIFSNDIYDLNASNTKDTSFLINELVGGSNKDTLNDVFETTDGGFLIAGSSSSSDGDITSNKGSLDGMLIKYDMYGKQEWIKTYGGSGVDEFYSVTETSDGFVAVGSTSSKDGDIHSKPLGGTDGLIIKVDKKGNYLWDKLYAGSLNDRFNSIITTKDGDIVVGGESIKTSAPDIDDTYIGFQDILLVKLDNSGNKKWDQVYGSSDFDYLGNLIETQDGNIVVAGEAYDTYGEITDTINGASDALLVKFDINTGMPIWDNLYGGMSPDSFKSVVENSKGELIATGNTTSYTTGEVTDGPIGNQDILVAKFDKDGNYIWDQITGTTEYDEAFDVDVDKDDNVLVVGNGKGNSVEVTDPNNGGQDALLIKLDDKGSIVENDSFGGSELDKFSSILVTKDNKKIMVGETNSTNGEITAPNKGKGDGMLLRDDLGKFNTKPVIKGADDIEVNNLSSFDPKEGVTAEDHEDGDLTDKIEINKKSPRSNDYDYVYSVSDTDGNKTIVHRKVTVKPTAVSNEKPTIKGINDITIKIGDYINIMEGISATDKEDGDLTNKIIITHNDLDNTKEGNYTITYSVSDSDSNTVELNRTVKVISDSSVKPGDKDNVDDKGKDLIETGKSIIYLYNLILISLTSFIIFKKQV